MRNPAAFTKDECRKPGCGQCIANGRENWVEEVRGKGQDEGTKKP